MLSFFHLVILFLSWKACAATLASNRFLRKHSSCTEAEQIKTDRLACRLGMFGPHGRKFPENYQELKGFCRESTNITNYLNDFFERCYTKEVTQYSRLFIYGTKKTFRSYCRSKSKKIDAVLKVTPCLNRHLIKDYSCTEEFIKQVETISNVDDSLKIPYTCCFLVKHTRCVEASVERYSCSRSQRDLIMDMMTQSTVDMANQLCGDYNQHTDRCDHLKPPPGKKSTVKFTNRKFQSTTYPLIDLVSSIKDPLGA